MRRRLRPASILFASLAASLSSHSWSTPDERPLWEQEALLLYSESSGDFNRLRSFGEENRRLALYTRALDILYGQERVEEGKNAYFESQRLFRILVSDNDVDAIGLASSYYLARSAQLNPFEKGVEEAKELYWQLFDRSRDRFFGQMAFAKYATLEAYNEDSERSAADRLEQIGKLLDEIYLPSIKQGVHRVLGDAYLQFEIEPRRAYEHFQSAYEIGIPVTSLRLKVLEQLSKLGAKLGEVERALRACEEILLLKPDYENRVEIKARAERLRSSL